MPVRRLKFDDKFDFYVVTGETDASVCGELKSFRESEYGYRVELRHQRDGYFASNACRRGQEIGTRGDGGA